MLPYLPPRIQWVKVPSGWLAPSHYLNQCWNIANWTLWNKLQWNFDWYSCFFIRRNAFENVVCEMAAILSRERWVNATVVAGSRSILSLVHGSNILILDLLNKVHPRFILYTHMHPVHLTHSVNPKQHGWQLTGSTGLHVLARKFLYFIVI